ncbi:hypothetical protein R1flu_003832 [Riccia fluitans]|uniref:Uncharacterized protein n=1 Tax=Riccia fluitans TaxID=41844 RepID=A0ABD1YDJ9_9MARC
MHAFKVSLHLFELQISRMSLKTIGSTGAQVAVNLPPISPFLHTGAEKLNLKSRLRLRPQCSGVPSSGPSFGALRPSDSEDETNIERRTSRDSVQMVKSDTKNENEVEDLLEAMRNALDLDNNTVSAYDTAWVAMIPNENDDGPLYPQSLNWICSNQRHDGAWADDTAVSVIEPVLSTLACVVALRTWDMASEWISKGERFLGEALSEMDEDDLNDVSPGLFHALAELLEDALRLGISLPYSSSAVKHLRNNHGLLIDSFKGNADMIKLCPRRILSFPEGLRSVIPWNKCSEIQSAGGDLFSSPAATACLVLATRDSKALGYLNRLLEQFGSAVPSTFPKRPHHLLSLVDHLQCLNVDSYFRKEIHVLLQRLSRDRKLGIDDQTEHSEDITERNMTEVMSFRSLREHEFTVLPEGSAFAECCNGDAEKLEAGSMLEMYRASELKFPGDEVLDYARDKSTSCLKALLKKAPEHAQSNLIEETRDVLEFPSFLKNRPVESMSYIDKFQFKDHNQETYVEGSFSRITHACNPRLLALAKTNFNTCQALYQNELQTLVRWEEEHRFKEVPFIRHPLYPSYLTAVGLASAPELSLARTCWTMSSVLTTAVDDLFDETSDISELRLFVQCVRSWDLSEVEHCAESVKIIARGLLSSVDYLTEAVKKFQERDLGTFFRRMWLDLAVSMMTEAEWAVSGYIPSSDEYIETAHISFALGPIVPLSVFFLGEVISDEELESQEYWDLFRTVATFGRLLNDSRTYQRDTKSGHVSAVSLYIREHPELTAEQSKAIIEDMVKEIGSKALSKLLNPTYSCPAVRTGWLSMMRALYMMYYRNVDGFSTTPEELKKKIKRFFFQPYTTTRV